MRGESARPGKRPLRALSASEKMDAIQRVHEGESKASVARDIGVPESTLRGWCKSEHKIRGMARNSSTPDSEAHSPASSSGANPISMTAGASTLSSEDEGPIIKKIKMEQAASCSANENIDSGETNKIDSKSKLDYVSNLMSTMAGMRPENSALLLQQLGLLSTATGTNLGGSLTGNLGANLTANLGASLAKNLMMPTGLAHPSAVGLVENGLQYTKSSGGLHSAHVSKRHSMSAIAPLDSVNKSGSRKSLPPAAEAPLTPVPASPRKSNETHSAAHQLQQYQLKNMKKDLSSGNNRKVDEALWQWLTQQQQLIGAQATPFNPTTHDGSWFWQWYKNLYPLNPTQPTTHYSKRSPSKSRALIDSVVCQNNNNNESFKRSFNLTDDDNVSLTTYEEAIIHGEKFFKWLDNCSDPSVSRVQIMQLKCLVDGLKCRKMPSSGVKRSRK